MPASTVPAAFEAFLRDLAPTAKQRSAIQGRLAVADGLLRNYFPGPSVPPEPVSNMPLHRTALIGSAAKDSIIRPIDDVDVLAVFSNQAKVFETYRADSRRFLYRVREALTGKRIQTVGARGQAVRLFYTDGGHVDIAPVFARAGGGFLLPAGDGSWLSTDPERGTAWLKERDVALGRQLCPLVRLLKAWNRAHSSRLRSFHLETVAGMLFRQLGTDQRQNLRVFFEHAAGRLTVTDPTSHGGALDGYLTPGVRQGLLSSLQTARQRSQAACVAEADGDHEEAIRLWGLTLGGEFPRYG